MGILRGASDMILTFLYCPDDIDQDIITIRGSEAHHIAKVLRLDRGEMIRMVDGQGAAHICEISSISPKKVDCRLIKTLMNSGEANLHLTLAIGLSGASKFDAVIEKGTETGVRRFVPLLTDKSKIKLGDKAAIARKLKRWQRVREAAVKQSGRSYLPDIDAPVSFETFIAACDPAETFLFHPSDRIDNFSTIIKLGVRNHISILVGPESGFSAAEIDLARKRGILCISLGSRVLRTETAGVVLSSLVIYLSEMVKG